ncbi:MAG: DEAD/DEAH box helicase [Candidatus Bathyarchaeota archaeon]|nr:DEAD/DEAH box helicase [Candidatus Bathyarchaeota archaeon]
MSAQNASAFALLAQPVQSALADFGFIEPTLPQALAFAPILEGKNVLLIAPTGTGKTEAVLLPIFSKLLEHKSPQQCGIQVIYITPLRALNRDMLKRLKYWSGKLDLTVDVRHGDTEMKIRRKQAKTPPQLLVTTPETLQAILPGSQMRRHLKNVEFVVIDEVHDLAASKRGAQLSLALERLRLVTGREFQRIGLSATIGNPQEVAGYLAGSRRPVLLVEASAEKSYRYSVEQPLPVEADFELAGKLESSPEAAARIRRMLELVDSHRSTLLFVNSRTVAEVLGYKLSQLGRGDIAVHHGSISKEERIAIEDAFKEGQLKAIICTSTLELGIDVGQVDLVLQYMSPRHVSSLIQRVGRSGHRLGGQSEGAVITVYPDDTLEALAAIRNAKRGCIEAVAMHVGALDVLAHQTAGLLMDLQAPLAVADLLRLIRRSHLYGSLQKSELLDLLRFLDSLNQIRLSEDEATLTKTRKTRPYYYENLSMIPDERRYPVINVISDRKIGSLGDEFMALHARVGLSFIMRGKVWRIVQIEDEAGVVHVVPSEDPMASVPGWDGEILPVPYELAQQTGQNRQRIAQALKETGDAAVAAEVLAKELGSDKASMAAAISEVEEQIKLGAPLPTQDHIVLEAYDRYLIVHACFGELVNKALGGIFDSVLSERELISGWWTDGYRILIEAPRKLNKYDLAELPQTLFGLTDQAVNDAFNRYLEAKFPFGYKMKFVAERFGVLPRGKTMSYQRQAELKSRFDNTPIYRETIREALMEKVDLETAKQIMRDVKAGHIKVTTYVSYDKPTPLAYHILSKFGDVSELMAPEKVLVSNIDKLKMAIDARVVMLMCMKCGQWTVQQKIKDLPPEPVCGKCGSGLLAPLYRSQDVNQLRDALTRRREGKELSPEELKELSVARRKADLTLSYGKQAVRALQVKGVGAETASRILGKMHPEEDKFYMDLLKAKIQFLRTREFWDK